ncbi:MAG: hypothetical protein LUQ67_05705, partial [Methanomicrobiales archaeon]|nr:hypothetical protein [Methanomicrobiales archaeon]
MGKITSLHPSSLHFRIALNLHPFSAASGSERGFLHVHGLATREGPCRKRGKKGAGNLFGIEDGLGLVPVGI